MKHREKRRATARFLALGVLIGGLAGLIGAGIQVPKSGAGQDKVEGFLNLVMKASSLDQVSEAFERGRFSEADARRIEAAVRKDPYRGKLASLRPKLPPIRMNQLEVSRKVVSNRAKGTAGSVSMTRARTSSKSVSEAKTATAARATRSKPVPANVPSAPAISTSDLEAITRQPGGGTEARISRVNPSALSAGQTFAISGSRFGRSRGSVEILLQRRRYICDLESWSDTAIRAVVPEYMESIIGSVTRDALLWIKPAGESLGPTEDIRLQPPPPPPGPRILSLDTREIAPGDNLALGGRNFGGTAGTAWCEFGIRRVRLEITRWTDADIRVRVPDDVSGIPSTRGTLHVRTSGGSETSHPVGYIPASEEQEIATYVELEGTWSSSETEVFHVFDGGQILKNGWTIVSYRLEKVSGRGSRRYMRNPQIGSSVLYQVIELHTSFNDLRVASIMVIRGPRGTDFF